MPVPFVTKPLIFGLLTAFLLCLFNPTLPHAKEQTKKQWLFLGSEGSVSAKGKMQTVLTQGGNYHLSLPEKNSVYLRMAHQDLAEWLGKTLNASQVSAHEPRNPQGHLEIRFTVMANAENGEISGAYDDHGFRIIFSKKKQHPVLEFSSPTHLGLRYGVWFFLQNFLHVRVLMPGKGGEVYRHLNHLQLPQDLSVENPRPDYRMRTWSGAKGWDHAVWLGDFGSQNRYRHHHNLWRVFAPKDWTRSHPEYFPVWDGIRYLPPKGLRTGWQPTFSEPSLVPRTLEYAKDHFFRNPKDLSISLTINDSRGYSQLDFSTPDGLSGNQALRHNYFSYLRESAKGLALEHPGKRVAFIPYLEMSLPPSFDLPDNIMPFLFLEPWKQFNSWKGKARHFGLYLWLYGRGWVFPNHWPHALQDLLQKGKSLGMDGIVAEAFPAWSLDGPKLWVLNNLLWNTQADVDLLLEDYYQHAYGKKAAKEMALFFERAEQVYSRRATDGLLNLARYRPGEYQFQEVTEKDVAYMRLHLDKARKLAEKTDNQTRLGQVDLAFRLTEKYWQKHHLLQILPAMPSAQGGQRDKILQAMSLVLKFDDNLWTFLADELEKESGFAIYGNPGEAIDWVKATPGFRLNNLDRSLSQAARHISQELLLASGPDFSVSYWQSVIAQRPELSAYGQSEIFFLKKIKPAPGGDLVNGSFSSQFPPDKFLPKNPKHLPDLNRAWKIYSIRSSNSHVDIVPGAGPAGRNAMVASGIADQTGVFQTLGLDPGRRYRLAFWYRTEQEARGVCYIKSDPEIKIKLPPTTSWQQFTVYFSVPYSKNSKEYFSLIIGLKDGRIPGHSFYLADLTLDSL